MTTTPTTTPTGRIVWVGRELSGLPRYGIDPDGIWAYAYAFFADRHGGGRHERGEIGLMRPLPDEQGAGLLELARRSRDDGDLCDVLGIAVQLLMAGPEYWQRGTPSVWGAIAVAVWHYRHGQDWRFADLDPLWHAPDAATAVAELVRLGQTGAAEEVRRFAA